MTVPNSSRMPARARKDAEKYLLPGEEAVVVTRRHWAVLIEPTVKFVPLLIAGGWLLRRTSSTRSASSGSRRA